ncbi:alpha/beta fold hydrolase [Hymenobacter weizhouensis]|uniref:alpha/beta fold hydrolase n=1 Tax=Hymenobacter sp. YIM 151500-1 TaxID=2987689 RepID=UPI002227D328|nr:alpha/beta fold hydrolase [Hymenobacter sp. YIM 151500-1]UYZ61508.1 alpha/beta fold hydrolase [Hymenobacter sp. YIM 151500-1]
MPATLFPWLNTQEYPFAPHYLSLPDGQRLHYVDEGQGPVLLFVHGTPSWSFEFRQQIKGLASSYRCVALDHIGFGLSDKPEHYDYRPQQHAHNLEHLIEHLGLRAITLIVHDFGGPIGLAYAVQQARNVRRLVILNSWLWDASEAPEFVKMRPVLASPLLPWLYRWFNFSPLFLLPSSFGARRLTPALRRHYTAPFSQAKERNGTVGFAQALLHEQSWFGMLWQQLPQLRDHPVLLLWGMQDKFFGPAYLRRFATAFRQPTIVELPTCGHVPQEEEGDMVLQHIQQFLSISFE